MIGKIYICKPGKGNQIKVQKMLLSRGYKWSGYDNEVRTGHTSDTLHVAYFSKPDGSLTFSRDTFKELVKYSERKYNYPIVYVGNYLMETE